MITSFGPTTFTITLGNASISLCVQLTATATAGEFTMYVGDRGATSCSGVTLTRSVATVTLDANNNITAFTPSNSFGGHNWASMTGSFGTTTGSGSIDSTNNPTGTNGSWAAGGTGRPVPKPHEAKHGHHA